MSQASGATLLFYLPAVGYDEPTGADAMKFDEMVEQSYHDLDEVKRDALKSLTTGRSDAEARVLWQMMCDAARVVTRWSEGHG